MDQYENFFHNTGNHQAADWMGMLRQHINSVGVDAALEALGPEQRGEEETVQYSGSDLEGRDADFINGYLSRTGIILVGDTFEDKNVRGISGLVPAARGEEGFHPGRRDKRDFFPSMPNILSKLEESRHLPGLESSEDLGKLMGGEVGSRVMSFSPDVMKKLDEQYGEGQWIVKPYDDEAYQGFGIYFPQRAQQIQKEAQNTIWASGENLSRYGFSHIRDEQGQIVGIKHTDGKEYRFKAEWAANEESGRPEIQIKGSPEYDKAIQGDARHWADQAAIASLSEKGATIPWGKYMAQPAFPVVGVTNEQRAQGFTGSTGGSGEARTHIITRNGKAEWVNHSTWMKGETVPVVFEDEDTRAIAKAAVDAINALPESERQGQAYAPDIVRTKDGYKVVEVNGALASGASGYLSDNPLIIDSYVSQITGREPQHVKFIRQLLTRRQKGKLKSLLPGANKGGRRDDDVRRVAYKTTGKALPSYLGGVASPGRLPGRRP